MAKKRITVSLDEEDLRQIEAAIAQGQFTSKSHAIADAVRQMFREPPDLSVETEEDRTFKRTLFGLRGTADREFDYGI